MIYRKKMPNNALNRPSKGRLDSPPIPPLFCEGRFHNHCSHAARDADRATVEKKPVRKITFLDPACGSAHFLLEAFDLFYAMYEEEGELQEPEDICASILANNVYGIDIDLRAVQIADRAPHIDAIPPRACL